LDCIEFARHFRGLYYWACCRRAYVLVCVQSDWHKPTKRDAVLEYLWQIPSYISLFVDCKCCEIQFTDDKDYFSPKIEISPRVVYFKSPVKLVFSKVFLMYSIALTPGTILFELEGDRFGIHAITSEAAKGINDTTFVRNLKKVERKKDNG
jgi:multicomponent Na+:H+ antiporter subunit E